MSITADLAASTLMFSEAREAGAAVARMIEANQATMRRLIARLHGKPPQAVITLARGSSDNACTYGRYLIENATGAVCASVGLSVGSIYNAPSQADEGLCIAVSQSGASPDLLAAVARTRDAGATVVGMINQPGSPLGELCDEVIALSAGPEVSVAATKSFVTSLAAFAWLVGEWSEDEALREGIHALPTLLDAAWEQDWSALQPPLLRATNTFVLGRGPGLGIAQEAALKLKETARLHAEAISAAEVAHGPMALVGPGFPVLAFAQADASLETTRATATDLAARGAAVMLAGAAADGATTLPTLAAHPAIEPVIAIQSFYRAAANLSVARGLDPDQPPHLSKVTKTV